MKSNITQGEWKVEMLGKSYKVATDEMLIADVHGNDENDREANAYLIAAAPSMLEALKELYDSLPDGYASECLPSVRKALAKAEGNI